MRILHFSPSFSTHDRRFLSALIARGHEMHFLCLAGTEQIPPMLPQAVTYEGTLNAGMEASDLKNLLPDFEDRLLAIRPDLLQAGPILSCGFLAALSTFRPFVAISYAHDILVDAEESEEMRQKVRQVLAAANAVICDCATVRERAISLVRTPEDHFIQFPWGIELQRFQPPIPVVNVRGKLKWEDKFVLVSARAWEKLYDIPALLFGFAIALRSAPNLRLLLVGDGSLRPEIETLIARESIGHAIHMPGRIDEGDLPAYLASANAYVSTAITDGSSITLLEAMACSLPVIVTDNPSNREWVSQENGWLFSIGDSEALATVFLQACSSTPEKLRGMGVLNQRMVKSRGDWNRNSTMLDEGLRRTLRKIKRYE